MLLTMRAKMFDDAKIQAEAMIATSEKKKNAEPAVYAGLIMSDKNYNPDLKHIDVAVKAIEVALKFEQTDA